MWIKAMYLIKFLNVLWKLWGNKVPYGLMVGQSYDDDITMMVNCHKVALYGTGWLSPLNEYAMNIDWQGEGLTWKYFVEIFCFYVDVAVWRSWLTHWTLTPAFLCSSQSTVAKILVCATSGWKRTTKHEWAICKWFFAERPIERDSHLCG